MNSIRQKKICDYIAFLHRGKLLLFEEKDRLLEEYAVVHATGEQLDTLPSTAIVRHRTLPYGSEVLCRRSLLPEHIKPERTTREEIILFLAKGGEAR